MTDNATPDVPVPWEDLNGVTWRQLREATYLAEMTLKGLAEAGSTDAAEALTEITVILSPDWTGPGSAVAFAGRKPSLRER